jgi:hypothetical protein
VNTAATVADSASVPSMFRLRWVRWFVRAWRQFGWRQVALAALISALSNLFGPNGGFLFGVLLLPRDVPVDPIYDFLIGRWLWDTLPLVFAVMIGDEAHRDGVRPVIAYGLALLAGSLAAGVLDVVGHHLVGIPGGDFRRFKMEKRLLLGSLCMGVYAYWRTTQRALARAQASEAEHARHRQQILATRLMALQARVEPQFLFDALSRVGELHERDAATADALLAGLIALLRAMLPVGTATMSTVEREFALAGSWLRVQRHLTGHFDVEIAASPLAQSSGLGAMLVLPLLQETAGPHARSFAWRLSAELVAAQQGVSRTPRLEIRLAPIAANLTPSLGEVAAAPAIERLRERLVQLYGSEATLSVWVLPGGASAFVLHLPLVQELSNDADRTDR